MPSGSPTSTSTRCTTSPLITANTEGLPLPHTLSRTSSLDQHRRCDQNSLVPAVRGQTRGLHDALKRLASAPPQTTQVVEIVKAKRVHSKMVRNSPSAPAIPTLGKPW